jgi:C1A family cysteine protease
VTPESVSALQAALTQQPISVSIDAETSYFQSYTSGVLTNAVSCGTTIDHAVLAVGFGTTGTTDYFIVKNSWGSSWGESGYINIAAVEGFGVCGIQSGPLYPTV